jgi:hypothetical protein
MDADHALSGAPFRGNLSDLDLVMAQEKTQKLAAGITGATGN